MSTGKGNKPDPTEASGSSTRILTDEEVARLVAYADRELDAEEEQEVRAWLDRDPVARAQFAALREVDRYLDLLPRARARPGLVEQTRATLLQSRQQTWRRVTGWLHVVLVAASAGLFLWGAYLFGAALQSAIGGREQVELLENMSLIENLPVLEELHSRDHFQALEQSGLFEQPLTVSREARETARGARTDDDES